MLLLRTAYNVRMNQIGHRRDLRLRTSVLKGSVLESDGQMTPSLGVET